MSRHPKLFTTFFMKENPLDGTSAKVHHGRSTIPLPERAMYMPALSSYEKDTNEFEVETYYGDQEYPQPPTDRVAYSYGVKLDVLRPELAQKYKENRQFWDSYFDTTNKEWGGKPEETTPRILWVRKHADYLVSKTELEIDAPLEEVIRFMVDDNFHLKVDPQRKSITTVREESPQCKIVHSMNHGNFFVSERDNLVYRFQFFEDQNTYKIMNFPAEENIHPVPKGVVRADMKLIGSTLIRLDKNKTKMIQCMMVNPKAPAPMFMMRGKIKEFTLKFVTMKKEIEKSAVLAK